MPVLYALKSFISHPFPARSESPGPEKAGTLHSGTRWSSAASRQRTQRAGKPFSGPCGHRTTPKSKEIDAAKTIATQTSFYITVFIESWPTKKQPAYFNYKNVLCQLPVQQKPAADF